MATELFGLSPRGRARRCHQLAAEAEASANEPLDPQVSELYRRIAARWMQLATEAELEARTYEDATSADEKLADEARTLGERSPS